MKAYLKMERLINAQRDGVVIGYASLEAPISAGKTTILREARKQIGNLYKGIEILYVEEPVETWKNPLEIPTEIYDLFTEDQLKEQDITPQSIVPLDLFYEGSRYTQNIKDDSPKTLNSSDYFTKGYPYDTNIDNEQHIKERKKEYIAGTNPVACIFQIYAFATRVCALQEAVDHAYEKKLKDPNYKCFILSERSVHSDQEVFAQTLVKEGQISLKEYCLYKDTYRFFTDEWNKIPSGILYLKTDAIIRQERLKRRGLACEVDSVTMEYQLHLDFMHERMIKNRINNNYIKILDWNAEMCGESGQKNLSVFCEKTKLMIDAIVSKSDIEKYNADARCELSIK